MLSTTVFAVAVVAVTTVSLIKTKKHINLISGNVLNACILEGKDA